MKNPIYLIVLFVVLASCSDIKVSNQDDYLRISQKDYTFFIMSFYFRGNFDGTRGHNSGAIYNYPWEKYEKFYRDTDDAKHIEEMKKFYYKEKSIWEKKKKKQ